MAKQSPLPRWKRSSDYVTINEQRMMLILDLLRKSVVPLTRAEITAALGWSDSVLRYNNTAGPLVLLQHEGKIGRIHVGAHLFRYYADPDISEQIIKPPPNC